MNPQDPSQGQPPQNMHNPLASMQQGERNICQVRRHPIGMIGMYITAGLLIIVVGVLGLVIAPLAFTSVDKNHVTAYGAVVFLIVSVLALLFVFVSHIVYWGNRWILTTDSLTQISQISLFNKQSSQLSLGNLEDVSAHQDGILPHLFNFGTLRVETAGEHSKFVFPFCPNPTYYAQQILHARESFEQSRRPAPYGNQDLNHSASQGDPYVPPSTGTPAANQVATYQVPTDDDLQR